MPEEESEEIENKETEKKQQPARKLPVKWIALALMLVVLGVGGYFGWNFLKAGKKEKPEAPKPEKSDARIEEKRVNYQLESFIVNLMDKSGLGKRYLKVTLVLELGGESDKIVLENNKSRLRDTMLLLLSSQYFSEINTMEGKLELKQVLLSRINQVLGPGIVRRIYFTEFVVQ